MARREVGVNLRKTLISVLILSLVLIFASYILAKENLVGMIDALSRANYLFVGLAIFVYAFGLFIFSTRWRTAVCTIGQDVSRRSLYLAVWGSTFINNVTPFTYSGGDPIARTYLLNKLTKTPFSSGLAVIAGEFLLDMPVFLSLLAFGLLFSFGRVEAMPALFLLGVWLLVLTVVVPLVPRFLRGRAAAERISGFIWRVARQFRLKTSKTKISRGVDRFYDGAYSIVQRRKCALTMVALSGMFWTFIMARLWLIFLAFGCPPSIQMLMLAATVPSIVGLVPVLPAGLGTVDMAFYFTYTSFGVDPIIATSAILTDRMITFVLGTLAGASALSYLGIRIWAKK